jgi:peptide/nickel transport system substrate-binding protein
LTEAGFPEGFETELVSNMLPQLGASMQSYLQAVGIKARLTQLLVAASVQRSWKGETPLFFASYGSYSINDVSAILPVYFTGDKDDYAGDPELKKLVEEGSSTNDPAKRKLAYSAAIKRATEQAYWMPLFTYVMTYGFSKSLKFKPYSDDLARFYLASWN